MSSTQPAHRARPVTSAPPTSPRTDDNPTYRRGRAIRSCLECRRRKMRCNRSRPCQNCNRFCRECVYLPFPEWPSGASGNVKAEVTAQSPVQGGGRAFAPLDSNPQSAYVQPSPFIKQEYDYSPDTLVKHDKIYDTDVDDDTLDVTIQIGRLSITEKSGDFCWPHIASQIATLLSQRNQFADPYRPQIPYGIHANQHPNHPAGLSTPVLVRPILPLEPSPGSTTTQLFLPQPGLELPSRNELHLLYTQYWSAVDPLAHIIHKPSFEGECRKYLQQGQVVDEAPVSFKALLLAMCLAAAVSLSPTQAKELLGVPQQSLVSRLRFTTDKALADANFMSSVNIQTLQAFTIYLIPQCRAEISRSHTVYVGALIRLAMSAGLNRDAEGPGIDPIYCQMRRLLWHQICFLDILTSEKQGPQPIIHDDQFDTSMPLNIKDDALERRIKGSVPVPGWTESTFSIIRYECSMVHRLIYGQLLAIEIGHTDLKTSQNVVNARRSRIDRLYLQYLDENIPIQRCAKLSGKLITAGFDAILLQRYAQFDVDSRSQGDVREMLIQSCLTVCECAVALDSDRDLEAWAWYASATHAYEKSIFLLMEMYRDPLSPHAARINRVLDHVFGPSPGLSSRERNRSLLQVLAQETNKMKGKIPQLALSTNGSCSPNDPSGMATTPEDPHPWNQWQPEPMYGHSYTRDLPPVTDGMWWPIPPQQGMLCGSAVSQPGEYAGPPHDAYSYGLGLGHA